MSIDGFLSGTALDMPEDAQMRHTSKGLLEGIEIMKAGVCNSGLRHKKYKRTTTIQMFARNHRYVVVMKAKSMASNMSH